MSASGPPALIAVLNTSEEVVKLVREVLQAEGWRTVTTTLPELGRRQAEVLAFLAEHDPRAIVYDVAVPYEETWDLLQRLRAATAHDDRRWVVTTTNKRALTELIGSVAAIEIIGKPYDLAEIVAAVRQALRDD